MTDVTITPPAAGADADSEPADGVATVYVRTETGWTEIRMGADEVIEITDHRGAEIAYVETDE